MSNANAATAAPAGQAPAGQATGQATDLGRTADAPRTTNPAEQTAGTRLPKPAAQQETQSPQAAPTEEVKPEGKQETSQVTKEAVHETVEAEKPVDKSNLQQVHDLVKDAGLDVSEVAGILNENGGKLTPEVLLALKEKYGEGVAGLIADSLGGMYRSQVEASKAKDKAVHDQVAEAFKGITEQSGEETWKELAGWAKENVPNEDRKEINALLAQGGLAAKLAVQELCNAFKEHTGTAQTQDAQLMEADGVRNGDDRGMIDKVTYTTELNALLAKGHDYSTSPEIKKLDARRMKSMKNGY